MNVYEVITSRILEQLESGVVPWRRPWTMVDSKNVATGKKYRGVNSITLPGGLFATFKQVKALGGHVKKGAHGFPVVFFSFPSGKEGEEEHEEETEKKGRTAPIIRYYHVFRVEDCEGLELEPIKGDEDKTTSIETAETIVQEMPNRPTIIEKSSGEAYYCPSTDTVQIPDRNQFSRIEEFYSTLFHELSHSTGHADRLGRKTRPAAAAFGSSNYGKEELVAEFGASFLCGAAKIDNTTIKNSASYIDSWKRVIKADSKLVLQAAGQAQRAADYILGKKPLTVE
jgi:antirestriction protein ArdC